MHFECKMQGQSEAADKYMQAKTLSQGIAEEQPSWLVLFFPVYYINTLLKMICCGSKLLPVFGPF